MSLPPNKKKLLLITQGVDADNPVLGVYHAWVEGLANSFEHVEVICLTQGRYTLPAHVSVHTLGKEQGRQPTFLYAWRFLKLAWKLRKQYDTVFVHMNQEYILLGGLLWKILDKPVYLWRNHYAGSWLTDIAVAFCTKVFCTSKSSYTARFKKTKLMPVGVDTNRFFEDERIVRKERSILFLSRMSPSKRPHVFVEALKLLHDNGVTFHASLVGSPFTEHDAYYEQVKTRVRTLGLRTVDIIPAIPNHETPDLYRAHEVCVNLSPSGMFDKTMFEAAMCGALVVAASDDWKETIDAAWSTDATPEDLARVLERALTMRREELQVCVEKQQKKVVEKHSFSHLMLELAHEMSSS